MSASEDAARRRIDDERRARGQRWVAFIDGLMGQFDIPDRDELIEMLSVAETEYEDAKLMGRGGDWSEQEADGLDELDVALWKTVELLQRLQYPIAKATAGASGATYAEESRAEDDLRMLVGKLAEVGRVVQGMPRRRQARGQRKSRDYAPEKALMEVVAHYWKVTLARKFTQNHSALGWGPPKEAGEADPTRKADEVEPKRKAGAAVRFSYAIIEYIAPGRGVSLKTIAREYVRPTYGK